MFCYQRHNIEDMKFSITTLEISHLIEEHLKHFSAAGFKVVHWCDHWKSDFLYTEAYANEIARTAERQNLKIQTIHGVGRLEGGQTLTEEKWYLLNTNRIEFISKLGGDCIVLHIPLNDHEHQFETDLFKSKRMIDSFLPVARKYGVKLAIENLETFSCKHLFDYLFDVYASEDLGFCFDSGHANIAGELDILERYLDRLFLTHLHDNHGEEDEHLLPGQGTTDWKPIILALKKKTDLPFVNIEVHWPTTIPIDTWCCQAYQSIENLWKQYHLPHS